MDYRTGPALRSQVVFFISRFGSDINDIMSSRLNINQESVVVSALDLVRAFDFVWVHKLIDHTCPITMSRQRAKYSDLLPITSIVPQGSISAQTFHNNFKADVPIHR